MPLMFSELLCSAMHGLGRRFERHGEDIGPLDRGAVKPQGAGDHQGDSRGNADAGRAADPGEEQAEPSTNASLSKKQTTSKVTSDGRLNINAHDV